MTARAGDCVMASLARLLLRVFFRRIDVEGATRLPAGPVLLVADHVNGLVDGLVLMAVLPRYPRFVGKATLYRILPLTPFLHLAGVVPVHRSRDAEGTPGQAVNRVHRLGGVAHVRAVMVDRRALVADLEQQRADLIEAANALVSVPARGGH